MMESSISPAQDSNAHFNEAIASYDRYKNSKESQDLDEAIKVMSNFSVSESSEDQQRIVEVQLNLADALTSRWDLERTTNISDLRNAITLTTSIAITVSNDPSLQAMSLFALGSKYMFLSIETRDFEDLWRGIACLSAVADTRQGEWSKKSSMKLENLMQNESVFILKALQDQRYPSPQLELFVNELGLVEPHTVVWIRDLSDAYWRVYHRTRKPELLGRGVLRINQYLSCSYIKEEDRNTAYCQLATMATSLYLENRTEENLGESIRVLKIAIEVSGNNEEALERCFIALGSIITSWFNSVTSSEEKNEVLIYAKLAITKSPEGDVRSLWLGTLSRLSNLKYQYTNDLDDLRDAINYSREAFNYESASEDIPWIVTSSQLVDDTTVSPTKTEIATRDHQLADLAGRLTGLLQVFYIRTGRRAAIEEATVVSELAASRYTDEHPATQYVSETLYLQYMILAENNEDIEYIAKQMNICDRVLLSKDQNQNSAWHRRHAECLVRRAERTRSKEDLEASIKELRENLLTTAPLEQMETFENLTALASAVLLRHQLFSSEDDLGEALKYALRANEVSQRLSIEQPELLESLIGTIYSSRFEKTSLDEDWIAAKKYFKRAVDLLPEDHMQRAYYLYQIARNLCLKPTEEAQSQGLTAYLKCWDAANASITARSLAGYQVMLLLINKQDWLGALSIAEQVLELQPFSIDLSLTVAELEGRAGRYAGMPSTVCALALSAGKNGGYALEQLELGRGIILGSMLNRSVNVSKLLKEHEALALQYEELQNMISNKSSALSTKLHESVKIMMERKDAVPRLIQCVKDIRTKPGFQRFLLGPSENDMQKIALNGYVVAVNLSSFRSDAIITSAHGIAVIALKDFTYEEASRWVFKDITEYKSEEYGAKNKQYRSFLSWLWKTCVKPVTTAIDGEKGKEEQPSRIWWIGTGLASFFPFHAAGNHEIVSSDFTLSHAISSYTPTFRSLVLARERPEAIKNEQGVRRSILLVTMPKTPGKSDLDGVENEVKAVQNAVDVQFKVSRLNYPSAESVMESLDEHDIIHFACHGVSNAKYNGLDSYLVFRKSPLQADNLHVRRVFESKFGRAKIAYLSACSSAGTFDARLSDEVIHLVSAFQAAGFRHVIGALWMTQDNICVEMAKCFYEEYCNLQKTMDGDDAVALAIHNATLKIRKKIPKQPLGWAPYVHFGP